MNLIHNERVKLLATTLNNLGIASVVTGVVAPTAGFVYGIGSWTQPIRLAGAILAWLVAGVGLHLIAQPVLRRSRDD